MKLTFLGTGTSQGVPIIGCDCAVCSSTDKRDKRLRCSVLISDGTTNLLVDVGPDLRYQMLREKVKHVDAIVITHEHNDHVIGLDDVRPFNFRSGNPMKVFAEERVAGELMKRFEYVFGKPIPGLPRIELMTIDDQTPFGIGAIPIQPIRVVHGKLPILAFRFGDLAYITDMKTISDKEIEKLHGVKHLIVNALRREPHYSHMHLDMALDFIKKINPERAYLTHLSHRFDLHTAINATLPDGVEVAYDGMQLDF